MVHEDRDMPGTTMADTSTQRKSLVQDEDFKASLASRLEEMSKVADLKAKFSQEQSSIVKPPPTAARKPPATANKPKVAGKPSSGQANGTTKPVPVMPNGLAKELSSVRLKHQERPTPSAREDRLSSSSESSAVPEWRNRLKPVPGASGKPTVTPKPGVKPPVSPGLKPPSSPGFKPPVSNKPSISAKPKVSKSDSGIESDGREHSGSGSIGSVKSNSSQDGSTESFKLAPLPPLEALGSPPRKPRKPMNVKLPPPTGVKTRKTATPERTSPSLPPRTPEPPRVPDLARIPEPSRVPEYPGHQAEVKDFQETYDDVETPPPLPSTANRPSLKKNRVSLIPTMGSDDEEEGDELYDEGSSAPLTSNGEVQDQQGSHTENHSGLPPPPPALTTLPVHIAQTSASSSSSNYPQTSSTSDNTGSGGDFGEIYDPVDEKEDDFDELYEPLDIDGGQTNTPGPDAAELEKEKEAEKKRQEKLKKDQERQQKKEEEKRKKEEKEEKKKKEKADKELKKKFKLKGDWTVMEMGTAKADVADENDKLQVICTKGDALEIIRKGSPNPAGKWLVRNTLGDPGYIDENLVLTSSDDFGDEYDAVGVDDADDFQDVYDIAS